MRNCARWVPPRIIVFVACTHGLYAARAVMETKQTITPVAQVVAVPGMNSTGRPVKSSRLQH